MANAQDSGNQFGPFTQALTGPLTPQAEQITPAYAPSKAGVLATYANAFLKGAQSARRTRYERSEQTKMQDERNFDATFAHIQSDPNISKEGKDAATQAYLQQKYSRVNEDLKKAGKDHKDNPLYNLTKSITGAVLGPTENKKNPDINVNSLLTIATDPKFKINPAEAGGKALESVIGGAQSISSGGQQPGPTGQQKPPTAPPAAQASGGGLPGYEPRTGAVQGGAPPQQATQPQQGTTPPPGTTPAAAQPPQATAQRTVPATQQEAWADPVFREQWNKLATQGIDPTGTQLGQWYAGLPKAGAPKPFGAKYQAKDAQGVLHEYQDVVDTSGVVSKVDHGEAKTPAPTSTAQKKQALIDDYKALGMTDEQATKKVAELDTKAVELKLQPKKTPEDLLMQNILDSGGAKDEAEAKQKAGKMLVDYQAAKNKAAQNSGGGGRSTFTPDELNALASYSIVTGQQPSFGLGANNPNRVAYQKALAHKLGGENGIGDALSAKTDFKTLSGSLANMQKLQGTVSSFEQSANKALDNAIEASKAVPRDSSAMVNGWDQWITKHTVDDPQLQQLFVYTETAANEYARVIGSITGASTNAAREQANSFIRSQLASQSFQAAADAMKTDMANRTRAIKDTISGLRSQITQIAKPQGGASTPPQALGVQTFTNKSGVKFEVGKPTKAPDGQWYLVTNISADGTITTSDTPVAPPK